MANATLLDPPVKHAALLASGFVIPATDFPPDILAASGGVIIGGTKK